MLLGLALELVHECLDINCDITIISKDVFAVKLILGGVEHQLFGIRIRILLFAVRIREC